MYFNHFLLHYGGTCVILPFAGVHGHLLQEKLRRELQRVQGPERALQGVGRPQVLHQRQVEGLHGAEVQGDLRRLLVGLARSPEVVIYITCLN